MHPGLYAYDEANNNANTINSIEGVYAALSGDSLLGGILGGTSSISGVSVDDRSMSIDDHLRSMPMPNAPWIDHAMNFRTPQVQDVDMLSMASTGKTVLSPLPSHHPVIVSRCDGTMPSSSDTSSSSCSPSSSENMHHIIKNNDPSIDASVTSILNLAMKPEPMDSEYMSAMHRLPMPLHLSYCGRCSEGSGPSGTCTPALTQVARRTRSSHDGMLKCQFCPKKWADQTALHTHMADCRLIRGHECSQCGKRFKARGGLQQHLRIHSNDRPYSCHYCAKRFTQKSHVDQHERIHTGAKPFTCQFCGRAFRQRSQQLGHEATHANQVGQLQDGQTEQIHSRSEDGHLPLMPESTSLNLLTLSQTPTCVNSVNSPVSSLLGLSQNPTPSNSNHFHSTNIHMQ